jgi:hypothetical protein
MQLELILVDRRYETGLLEIFFTESSKESLMLKEQKVLRNINHFESIDVSFDNDCQRFFDQTILNVYLVSFAWYCKRSS